MNFGHLVLTAFTRNPLRSFFTFAAVAAAFCLYGALETIRYERDLPAADQDLVMVVGDANRSMPVDYENTILAMPGVKSVTGLIGMVGQHPKTPTDFLTVLALNPERTPVTLAGLAIAPDVAKRWQQTRIGAICDERTAREMGWHVNDRISVRLMLGMTTASGESEFELILVGTYSGHSMVSGLLARDDYLRTAFPGRVYLGNIFVRPERARDTRSVARRIDEQFRSGVVPTLSAPVSDFRESAARDAGTTQLVMRGALVISFFTMVLIVANALAQSLRERLGEMAVMQALGFQERTLLMLVLGEALALFALGAATGLLLANIGFAFEIAGARSDSAALPVHTLLTAAVYVVVCASIAALLPCWELSRLQVADALRRL